MFLKKVIIADDDDAIAHLVGATLGDAGYLCLRARNGDEALHMARREAPDLMVLDVRMPEMDGLEVARRIKADVLSSRIPILMLTSLGDVDDRVQGLEAGADDYLTKPFDVRELAARVHALIRAAKREGSRNPTTHLPGSEAVEQHVNGLLKGGSETALLHLDIDRFEEYADAFGFRRADEVVAELGELILDKARSHSGSDAFVGHVGGDDFVVTVAQEKGEALATDLLEAFDHRIPKWYSGEAGSQQMAPRMTLSIALLNLKDCQAESTDALSRYLAAAKRQSKKKSSSNFVVWSQE